MGIIEGTRGLKTVEAAYDFAVDGGAIGSITLRGDNTIPAGSVILEGYIDVETAVAPTSVSTVALTVEGAGDIRAAAVASDLTTGRKDIVPVFTGATSVKTTVTRSIVMAIAAGTLTAGKFRVVLIYR